MASIYRVVVDIVGSEPCIVPLKASFDGLDWIELSDSSMWHVDGARFGLYCSFDECFVDTAPCSVEFTVVGDWAVGQNWAYFLSGSSMCSSDAYWNTNACTVTVYDTNGAVIGSASGVGPYGVIVPLKYRGWWSGFFGCAEE